MSSTEERGAFNPAAHLRKIRTKQGMQDYLDVKWRIAWLHSVHLTGASIFTEIAQLDERIAVFKATVTINGDVFTGHGSETPGDFGDFIEKAETKSIGRALATAGYGTDYASDLDDGEPLDGRAAAKDERAGRRMDGGESAAPTPPPAPRPEPSRLPATRGERPQRTTTAPDAPDAPTGTPARATGTDDPNRVNGPQVLQLRALEEQGFPVEERVHALGLEAINELSREQARVMIVAGRESVRSQRA